MFSRRSHPRLAVSLIAAAVSAANVAQAQVLEEVIVTAQKRAQSAQDLGMSVSAFSGDSMRTMGISQAEDLAQVIPNVSSLNVSGGGVPVIIVRGVGLQNFRVNDSPTTAVYVDEVYQTSIAAAEFSMFDLERLELLKGPQAGLYGRNTISGALQVISERPNIGEEGNGYLHLEYGEFNRIQAEGGASIPLSDKATMRLSGRWEQSDDRQWESITNDFEHGEIDNWAARGLFRIAPNDDIDLLLKVHSGSDQSDLPLLRPLPVLADYGTAADLGLSIPNAENIGLSNLGPDTCSSILEGNGVGPGCVNNTSISNEEYGLGNSDSDRYDSASNLGGYLDNSWSGVSLNAAFTLGDYVLTSISAYDTLDYQRVSDLDAMPIAWSEADYGTEVDAWSQEFRLAYDGAGSVTWVAGLNYAEDDLEEYTRFNGAEGGFPALFNGVTYGLQDYDQSTETIAAYGHLEWGFSDDWNLVTEARYTDVEKSFKAQQYLGFPGGLEVPWIAGDDDTAFDNLSGKLALEWSLSDEVMAYGSASSGFKTGGFFGGLVFSESSLEPFDEETILAYEIGVKSELADGRVRLNGAIFYYDREDVQQTATDFSGEIAVSRLTNVGDVEVYGAEVDFTWQATEHLSLQLGLGTTDSKIVDSDMYSSTVPGIPLSPIEGTNTPNYSEFSGNFVGRYERPMGDELYGFAQLEYSYRSDVDLNLITSEPEEKVLQEEGYGLTNLRIGLGPQSGQWQAMLFVDNLTDESYRVLARDNGLRGMHTLSGEPRIWGASFTYYWGS